jgi:hypothetical protein
MGSMTAEMLDIDSQDRLEVASSEDEHPVEALTLERADEPIGDCVGLGALIGVRTIRSPSERKISSRRPRTSCPGRGLGTETGGIHPTGR